MRDTPGWFWLGRLVLKPNVDLEHRLSSKSQFIRDFPKLLSGNLTSVIGSRFNGRGFEEGVLSLPAKTFKQNDSKNSNSRDFGFQTTEKLPAPSTSRWAGYRRHEGARARELAEVIEERFGERNTDESPQSALVSAGGPHPKYAGMETAEKG